MHLSITPLIGLSYVHEWWGGSIRWGCDYTHFTLFVLTYKKNIQWWLAKKKNHLFCKYSCTTQLLRPTYLSMYQLTKNTWGAKLYFLRCRKHCIIFFCFLLAIRTSKQESMRILVCMTFYTNDFNSSYYMLAYWQNWTLKDKGKFSFVLTPVLVYNQSEKGWVLEWWGFEKENPPLPCPN